MKILVLGGTQFIGRNFVENIVAADKGKYDIFLANRNSSNTRLFTDINRILIDRTESERCKELQDIGFDVVVDFSCYNLVEFLNTFKHLKFKRYIFISSTAVSYMEANKHTGQDRRVFEYAINKKEVESFIETNIQNYTIIRPCVVFGEHDNTNRFYLGSDGSYYWKYTNEKAKAGAVSVETVSKALIDIINNTDNNSIITICNS
jgi:nucleoside-diphosphate-sugar epimerase